MIMIIMIPYLPSLPPPRVQSSVTMIMQRLTVVALPVVSGTEGAKVVRPTEAFMFQLDFGSSSASLPGCL